MKKTTAQNTIWVLNVPVIKKGHFAVKSRRGWIFKNNSLVGRKQKNINVLTAEQIEALIIPSYLAERALNIHV